MSDFYVDIGWKSIYHFGEELCGDHVEVIESDKETETLITVLADGLGSGVKASILSTLTSKIFSTMLAQGMSLEDCVSAVVAALPVDSAKGVAYSTFSIIRTIAGKEAELIQFDNPAIIFMRGCNQMRYPQEEMIIQGKKIYKSNIKLQSGDLFIMMSDGVTNASATRKYNYQWTGKDIADYMKIFAPVGYTAKTMATMLIDECYRKYGEHPLDDATACVLAIRPSAVTNIMFGPARDRVKEPEMLKAFFEKGGRHIVCGGTTAKVVGRYLGKEVKPVNNIGKTDIPPMSEIEGVDLVTEGVITMNRVNEYVGNNIHDNSRYAEWSSGRDGASRITRFLLEEASEVNFFVGTAVNEAHDNVNLPANFNVKMQIVNELTKYLRIMGKKVTIQYY